MTTTLPAPDSGAGSTPSPLEHPRRAAGLELIGEMGGSGYRKGTFLVRRGGHQMVQLTPLLFHLLEALPEASSSAPEVDLAAELSRRVDRTASDSDVQVLLGKLAQLGMLQGTEPEEAPRSNPLLALRLKFVVSNPRWTRRITAPFAWLFHPVVLWPVLAAFVVVCWFVMVDKGLASATSSAFQSPGLLLAVFAVAVLSAGFHELGHAAACSYGGAQPGAMGGGLYLVFPAFYTDVSDAYRLSRRGRLRVDLGGLYFNAVVAVATMVVWLAWRQDALLLLVATQLLQMVRQLSPVIRADGYHILADLTGVPDLFSHIGPTLRGFLPWRRREPSPLTLRARLLVTAWVLVVVPVLISLMLGAILLLPQLVTTAWTSGHHQLNLFGDATSQGDVTGAAAAIVRLFALVLPVVGSAFITTRVVRTTVGKTLSATAGHPIRRTGAALAGIAVVAAAAWGWWPHGQYQVIRPSDRGTVGTFLTSVSHPTNVLRPASAPATTTAGVPTAAPVALHRRLSLVMVPSDGQISAAHPAVMLVPTTADQHGPMQAVLLDAPQAGVAFPFTLPSAPKPGDTQALALGTKDGAITYNVSYAVVTVDGTAPVSNRNSAYALASCKACTTVAVSFQIVLVVGQSHQIDPVDVAVAGNSSCPSCITTALAEQLVVTLRSEPTPDLVAKLNAALATLSQGGVNPADTAALTAQVAGVQATVEKLLNDSGLTTSTVGASATPSAGVASANTSRTSASTAAPASASASAIPGSSSPTHSAVPTSSAATTTPASGTPTASAAPSPQTSESAPPSAAASSSP